MPSYVHLVGTATALNFMVSAHMPEVIGHYLHSVIILMDRTHDVFAVT